MVYSAKSSNKHSNCRLWGCMESQEYTSSIANVADTLSKALSKNYMCPRSNCGAKGAEATAAAGQHKGGSNQLGAMQEKKRLMIARTGDQAQHQ